MKSWKQSGQAMVELAIGVAIFLLATLGAVQLGLSALAQEGLQSAALTGARIASAGPLPGDPMQRLSAGRAAAIAAIAADSMGLAEVAGCLSGSSDGCGVGTTCVAYHNGISQPGTDLPCAQVSGKSGETYGPAPYELDGRQNPGCPSGPCFGASRAMAACATAAAPGRLRVCVAYTSWPPLAVDIWITGGLRTITPWLSSTGLDVEPVSVRLRLQVEAFSS